VVFVLPVPGAIRWGKVASGALEGGVSLQDLIYRTVVGGGLLSGTKSSSRVGDLG